jgi:antitoxin component of RelBE/YafQ-DinJ toxin-antitoxin module
MSTKSTIISETTIKFYVPERLKQRLQALADERGLTLSAFMRLIATEYIKLKK